jgi:glutamate--cysteine ligase catalytic subunit
MGFLSVQGGVLTYNQYKSKIEQYKKHGLRQFVSIYKAHKSRSIPLKELKWGEEMEYQIYAQDQQEGTLALSNRGPELIQLFNSSKQGGKSGIMLMPEFGAWMIEAVPSKPYDSLVDPAVLLSCESKLHLRREVLNEFCEKNGVQMVSLPNAPSLGTENHITIDDAELARKIKENAKDLSSINEASRSKFVIDKTINSHPRFAGLVKSIRERRGSKVEIKVPIYKDVYTNMTEATEREPYPGFIYMDAMHFGMGQCCL